MANVYSDVRKAIRRAAIQSLIEFFPTTEDQNNYIIFSHVGGSEPVNPYVVINILGIEQQGRSQVSSLTDNAFDLSVQAQYEVTVQFGFCGSTAGDMAHTFTQRVNNNPITMEAFRKESLSVMRKSNLRRVPQKRDTKWVEYFNQDFVFAYIVNTTQPVDYVETIVLEDKSLDPSTVFTVPPNVPIP